MVVDKRRNLPAPETDEPPPVPVTFDALDLDHRIDGSDDPAAATNRDASLAARLALVVDQQRRDVLRRSQRGQLGDLRGPERRVVLALLSEPCEPREGVDDGQDRLGPANLLADRGKQNLPRWLRPGVLTNEDTQRRQIRQRGGERPGGLLRGIDDRATRNRALEEGRGRRRDRHRHRPHEGRLADLRQRRHERHRSAPQVPLPDLLLSNLYPGSLLARRPEDQPAGHPLGAHIGTVESTKDRLLAAVARSGEQRPRRAGDRHAEREPHRDMRRRQQLRATRRTSRKRSRTIPSAREPTIRTADPLHRIEEVLHPRIPLRERAHDVPPYVCCPTRRGLPSPGSEPPPSPSGPARDDRAWRFAPQAPVRRPRARGRDTWAATRGGPRRGSGGIRREPPSAHSGTWCMIFRIRWRTAGLVVAFTRRAISRERPGGGGSADTASNIDRARRATARSSADPRGGSEPQYGKS